MSSMLDIDPKIVQKRWMRLRLGSWVSVCVRSTRAKKPVESGLHFNSSEEKSCVNHTIYCTSRLLQSHNTALIIIMNIILDYILYCIQLHFILYLVLYCILLYIMLNYILYSNVLYYIIYIYIYIYIYIFFFNIKLYIFFILLYYITFYYVLLYILCYIIFYMYYNMT